MRHSFEVFTLALLTKIHNEDELDAALDEVNINATLEKQDMQELHDKSKIPAAKKLNRYHKLRAEVMAIQV